MNDDLDLLIERYLLGACTAEEIRRLEELLKTDRAALRSFLLALDEDVSLRKLQSFDPAKEPVVRRPRTRIWRTPAPYPWTQLLIGAGFVAAVLVLLSVVTTPAPAPVRTGKIRNAEDRRHAQDRLVEIERERQTIVELPQKVDSQRRRLDELDEERRRIEEDLKTAAEQPRIETPPAPPPPTIPPENKAPTTVAAPPVRVEIPVLTLDRIEGSVVIVGDSRVDAAAGARIPAGRGLDTVGPRSSAVASFADGTRLEIGPETSIREAFDVDGRKGKRLTLARGTLTARVVHQPLGAPMVLTTPQAEVKVLGTVLRLTVEGDEKGSTRVEVTDGKVNIRRGDGKSLEVSAGHFAVASSGGEWGSKPLPIDDIILGAEQARLVGGEWKPVKDAATGTGLALEALETAYKVKRPGGTFQYDSVRNRTAYVLFTFQADAGKDYHVWIRGRTLATTEKNLHDEVAIEPVGGQLSQRCRQLGPTGDNAFCYTGWKLYSGYGWIGGYGEDGAGDTTPLSIRFPRSGIQTLKLYAIECPMRIDGLWLSTTQSTRPPADQRLPIRESK